MNGKALPLRSALSEVDTAMAEILFWVCCLGAVYSYLLYPFILLACLPLVQRKPVIDPYRPGSLTLIVTARNEEANIEKKIKNTLALQSPTPLEIIIASDASDDRTDAIVGKFSERGVRLVRNPVRGGKEAAQARAIAESTGEVIIFSDVGTILPQDALVHLLKAFEDRSVGAVSSEDRMISDDGTVEGEGLYIRYEMWLRNLESRVGSLVGLSGSFFAARREVCKDFDTRVPSDFGTALNCIRCGYRAVSDPKVLGYYRSISDPNKEYQRKVRTVTRGMSGLWRRIEVLNPVRFGGFSFQVFSHKMMRWLVPWFLLGTLLTSSVLAPRNVFFAAMLGLQLAGYAMAFATSRSPVLMRVGIFRVWRFFVESNLAVMRAAIQFLQGRATLTWEPSKR